MQDDEISCDSQQSSDDGNDVNSHVKAAWESCANFGSYYKRLDLVGDLVLNVADVRYLSRHWFSHRYFVMYEVSLGGRFSFSDEASACAFVDFILATKPRKIVLSRYTMMPFTCFPLTWVVRQMDRIDCLGLDSIDLVGSAKGKDIRDLLRSKCCFTDLDFNRCSLDLHSCVEIAEGLKERRLGLQKFNVTEPKGAGAVEFRMLVRGLASLPAAISLKEVTFSDWQEVNGNSTGTGFASLACVLKACHALELLGLFSCNAFLDIEPNDPGYLQFTQSLRDHKSLKYLYLRDDWISDALAAPLFRALKGGAVSLNTLVLGLGSNWELHESLIESLAGWKNLERLTVNANWDRPELIKALQQNTSLMFVNNRSLNSIKIEQITRRNRTITKTIPKLLGSRNKSHAMAWPLCLICLMRDSDDMTPVFLFAKATLGPMMEEHLKSYLEHCELMHPRE